MAQTIVAPSSAAAAWGSWSVWRSPLALPTHSLNSRHASACAPLQVCLPAVTAAAQDLRLQAGGQNCQTRSVGRPFDPRRTSSAATAGENSSRSRRGSSSSNDSSSNRRVGRDYSEASLAKCDLREALLLVDRGLADRGGGNERVMGAANALARLGEGKATTAKEELSGNWRLLWTTEKETLLIFKAAEWLGTKAGDVLQTINVANRSLSNVITFPPSGALITRIRQAADSIQDV